MSSYFPQVGDFVMIRSWDDMVKEFGTDSYGDIYSLITGHNLMCKG